MLMGVIPMCSDQYIFSHNMWRKPGRDCDTNVPIDSNTTHIALWYKHVWYTVDVYVNGRMLRPAEVQRYVALFCFAKFCAKL